MFKRRLLPMILSVLMIFTLMPTLAFAGEGEGADAGDGGSEQPITLESVVDDALAYKYDDYFAPRADARVKVLSSDGNAISIVGTYTHDELAAYSEAPEEADAALVSPDAISTDMARLVGALYRYNDGETVKSIKYADNTYTWYVRAADDTEGDVDIPNSEGSNWQRVSSDDANVKYALTDDIAAALKTQVKEQNSTEFAFSFTLYGDDETELGTLTFNSKVNSASTDMEGDAADEVAPPVLSYAVEKADAGSTIRLVDSLNWTQVATGALTITKDITIEGLEPTSFRDLYVIHGISSSLDAYFNITGGHVTFRNIRFMEFGNTAAAQTGYTIIKVPADADGAKVTVERCIFSDFGRAALDVRNGAFEVEDCTIFCDNDQENQLTKGIVAGYDATGTVTGTVTDTTIIGSDSTYEGFSANGIEISAGSTVTIKNCTIESMEGGISVERNYGHGIAAVIVEDSRIQGKSYAMCIFESNNSTDPVSDTSATIIAAGCRIDGNISISIGDDKTSDGSSKIALKGGSYTAAPLKSFIAEGYRAAVNDGNDKFAYPIALVEGLASETAAEVSQKAAASEVKVSEDAEIDTEVAAEISEALSGAALAVGQLQARMIEIAEENTIKADTVVSDGCTVRDLLKRALNLDDSSTLDDDDIAIVVQPYLDIKIDGATTESNEDGNKSYKSLSLDVTPMYNLVATKSENVNSIKTNGDEKNAIAIGDAKEMNIDSWVTVSIPLPDRFVTSTSEELCITHTKHDGTQENCNYDITRSDGAYTLEISTKGLSPITITKGVMAEVDYINYSTLADAIEAVKVYGTINLLADCAENITVNCTTSTTRAFYLDPNGYAFTGSITAGSGINMIVKETGSDAKFYMFTKKASSGSSGSSSSGSSSSSSGSSSSGSSGSSSGGSSSKGSSSSGSSTSGTGSSSNTGTSTGNVNVPVPVVDPTPEAPVINFGDIVSDAWYAEAVDFVVSKKIMNGMGDGNFAPDELLTRSMLMTMLARYDGEDTDGGSVWYEKGMNWAVNNKISDGTDPAGNITREQLVTMLYRYAGSPAMISSAATFTDSDSVSDYAKDAVAWALANNIVTGMDDGTFAPQANATRAQVAAMLMRCVKVL